jgi:hypothetical protein
MKIWKKLLIILGILFVLGVVAAFLVIKYVINKPHPNYAVVKPDMEVRAKRLWTDFSSNQEIANKRFTGKVLQFEGQITRVEMNDTLCIVVFAYKAGDFGDEGIRVTMLPQYIEASRHIDPFKSVKLKGLCTGFNGTDVIIEKGSIVEPQK